ncbi:hypothetical protein HPB47_010144 [Ixodes persulcatus]|uniref:Uncharacterized protein n=1 Tax=Ixodes persulcatus TaxID=34615 RepID=A0AC60NZX6_IXOPE|nr:hypothetical protein HPB47_010144 [Ixodes persulcatus]
MYGNLHTLPRSTANPMTASRNSIFLSHFSRPSSVSGTTLGTAGTMGATEATGAPPDDDDTTRGGTAATGPDTGPGSEAGSPGLAIAAGGLLPRASEGRLSPPRSMGPWDVRGICGAPRVRPAGTSGAGPAGRHRPRHVGPGLLLATLLYPAPRCSAGGVRGARVCAPSAHLSDVPDEELRAGACSHVGSSFELGAPTGLQAPKCSRRLSLKPIRRCDWHRMTMRSHWQKKYAPFWLR